MKQGNCQVQVGGVCTELWLLSNQIVVESSNKDHKVPLDFLEGKNIWGLGVFQ